MAVPAVGGCELDAAGLREQAARYARLGAVAASVARSPGGLTVQFATAPDAELLTTVLAIERGCCASLTLAYDAGLRQLDIAADDPSGQPALDLIERALRSGAPPA